MHYFEKMSSASGVFVAKSPSGLCLWTPLRDFRISDPLIAHLLLEKIPAGAHEHSAEFLPL